MKKLQIESLEDVKITSMSHYAVHFKVKDESYLYHKSSDEYGRQQIRAKVAGQRKTNFVNAGYGVFYGVDELKIHPTQPYSDTRVKERFVRKLEFEGFADTPFKTEKEPTNEEIIRQIKVYEDKIQKLKDILKP